MAVQEVAERLGTDLGEESDDDSEVVSLIVQLIRMLSLLAKSKALVYECCISEDNLRVSHIAFPRLALRKSPSQSLASLEELEQLLSPAAKQATVAEARSLVRNVALIIQELGVWVKGRAGDDFSELAASNVSKLLHNSRLSQIRSSHDRPVLRHS
jgi:hypothetical protein